MSGPVKPEQLQIGYHQSLQSHTVFCNFLGVFLQSSEYGSPGFRLRWSRANVKRPIFPLSHPSNEGCLTDPYPNDNSALSCFEQETLPHKSVLYQSAYSLLRCRGEAEDAVQETYLQAWKSFPRFQAGTNCRAWMFSILFNVVRRQRRKWIYRFYLTNDSAVFETGACLALPLYDQLTDPEILAALSRLPRPYAEAVILSDVAEFSYKEVSDTMSCPIGTVMSRVSRGRELLRRILTQSGSRYGVLRARVRSDR